MIRKFLKIEVVLSIIIPLIISAFSYVSAQAKYTERLGQAEQTINKLQQTDKDIQEKVTSHAFENQKESDQLLIQIKVIDTKLDSVKEDLQDIKKSIHK